MSSFDLPMASTTRREREYLACLQPHPETLLADKGRGSERGRDLYTPNTLICFSCAEKIKQAPALIVLKKCAWPEGKRAGGGGGQRSG
jgi:hypothetical protein